MRVLKSKNNVTLSFAGGSFKVCKGRESIETKNSVLALEYFYKLIQRG